MHAAIEQHAGDFEATAEAVSPLIEAAFRELQALRPPTDLEAQVKKWMALNATAADEL